MASGEFTVVKRKGKRNHRSTPLRDNGSSAGSSSIKNDAFDSLHLKKRLQENEQELRLCELLQDCTDNIQEALKLLALDTTGSYWADGQLIKGDKGSEKAESPLVRKPSLIGYGIGRFSSCPIARYQLAFLLLLQEKLQTEPPLLYDPVFSAEEIKFLEELGCELIPFNEEGKHVCPVPTILFMPHCGKALYNNVLWANMTRLPNLFIIGNSFSRMMESTPGKHLMKTANYVMKVSPYMTETPIKSSTFTHCDVFNDLSLHVFHPSTLKNTNQQFWEENAEPEYDEEDVEIIQKESCQEGKL